MNSEEHVDGGGKMTATEALKEWWKCKEVVIYVASVIFSLLLVFFLSQSTVIPPQYALIPGMVIYVTEALMADYIDEIPDLAAAIANGQHDGNSFIAIYLGMAK